MSEPRQVINAWAETERDTCLSATRREQRNDERLKSRENLISVLEGSVLEGSARGRRGKAKSCQGIDRTEQRDLIITDKCITSPYARIICSEQLPYQSGLNISRLQTTTTPTMLSRLAQQRVGAQAVLLRRRIVSTARKIPQNPAVRQQQKRTLVSAPKPGDGPLMERRPDRELPSNSPLSVLPLPHPFPIHTATNPKSSPPP
jgi:hypothetical protein